MKRVMQWIELRTDPVMLAATSLALSCFALGLAIGRLLCD
jgi:hypothetical protein